MKLFLTLLLLLLSVTLHATKNMNVVRIEFEGHRYDSLRLILFLDDRQHESISGLSEDGSYWIFSYPDSLYDYISDTYLSTPGTDFVRHLIRFSLVLQDDTLMAGRYFFGRPSSLVKARYVETITHPNIPMIRRGTTDDVILGTIISDDFEISTDDQDLISSMKIMHYGYGYYTEELTYEEMMQQDMDFIRQYPNSRRRISLLSSNMGLYRSKDDIAKLFNLFSEELQQSFYGQKVDKYITRRDTVFKNQMLSAWDTDMPELIVQDSSKFNLILFSASWCGPCMRQIPIVKEIYQNLGDKLIMTYVSLDHERTVENWREKMHTHKIPWRSLMVLTEKKDKAIRDDYEIFGVPHAILVYPSNMKMEKLDLWKEEDRQRLYELVK